MTAPPSPVHLTVLTGFLGSGKTTLLGLILADPAFADTAVLINEFGDVGLDHLLVERLDDDIILLASGCVCCTIGDDLAGTLTRLMAARVQGGVAHFGRIVLETTGIADPGPILQAVAALPDGAGKVLPGAVVTVVDAVLGEATLDSSPENLRQVAMADVIVLSKQDLAGQAPLARLSNRLRTLAPGALIIERGQALADPACLFAPRTAPAVISSLAGHHHGHGYHSFTLGWDQPVAWTAFAAWLEALLGARGEDILRLKGLIRIEGRAGPLVVQGVQHMLFAPRALADWPSASQGPIWCLSPAISRARPLCAA